jgi:hypothetical protein
VTVCRSCDEALRSSTQRSFELIVLDMGIAAGGHGDFIQAYRSAPCMGLVPVLLLSQLDAQTALEVWPPRTLVVPAHGDLERAVHRLLSARQPGQSRVAVRLSASLPVQVRFGGRVFSAEAINVSRGGMLIQTAHLPSINTDLGVALLVDGERIEAQGVALRVVLGRDRDRHAEVARIGIALRRFVGDSEARYIAYLAALAERERELAQAGLTARARGWLQGLQRI